MTCRCGREMKLINEASDDLKCSGCGFPDEGCTCTPLMTVDV
jgi:hypothetical protein